MIDRAWSGGRLRVGVIQSSLGERRRAAMVHWTCSPSRYSTGDHLGWATERSQSDARECRHLYVSCRAIRSPAAAAGDDARISRVSSAVAYLHNVCYSLPRAQRGWFIVFSSVRCDFVCLSNSWTVRAIVTKFSGRKGGHVRKWLYKGATGDDLRSLML